MSNAGCSVSDDDKMHLKMGAEKEVATARIAAERVRELEGSTESLQSEKAELCGVSKAYSGC